MGHGKLAERKVKKGAGEAGLAQLQQQGEEESIALSTCPAALLALLGSGLATPTLPRSCPVTFQGGFCTRKHLILSQSSLKAGWCLLARLMPGLAAPALALPLAASLCLLRGPALAPQYPVPCHMMASMPQSHSLKS